MKKIAIILGTRPEIIKLSPVIREYVKRKLPFFILHTHQHYSENLDKVFFKNLNLPSPKYHLQVGSGGHGEQTGRMLIGIEEILLKEKPGVVLVEGDTNTVLAGALSAVKLHIPVGHVESGLRSHDRNMPEESNRIMVDHISDFLFAPTRESKNNLIRENISAKKIFVVGNTIVDAIMQNIKISDNSNILKTLNLQPGKYFLITAHRQENVDNENRLRSIIKGLTLVAKEHNIPVIFPMHPRTAKMIEHFNLSLNGAVRLIEPVGYFDFLNLMKNARLILTDSGGIQEEASILRVPCITLRDNTERPETLVGGGNRIAGVSHQSILREVRKMIKNRTLIKWGAPFGKGNSSGKIIDIISKRI